MVADVVVSGRRRRASGIPYPGADNSFDTPELGVGTPESAQGEISRLHRVVRYRIQQRRLQLCRWNS
ncbi:MAG: hypothetical protein ABIH70_04995 [Chloroflexota bacterium]